jgi:hypothetical protein
MVKLFGISSETDELLWAFIAYQAEEYDKRYRYGAMESDIVEVLKMALVRMPNAGRFFPGIPVNRELDTIVFEMRFQFGRADIVMFHVDGSATVVEVKNGSNGYNSVASGIGQANLYAAQLANARNSLTKVRKCLLWTSTGNSAEDAAIVSACELAGVVPALIGRTANSLMAVMDAMGSAMQNVRLELEAILRDQK